MFVIYVDRGRNGIFPELDELWGKYEFDNYQDAYNTLQSLQKENPREKLIIIEE